MKKFFFVAFLLSLIVFIWWRFVSQPVDTKGSNSIVFVIPKGQGIDTIGKRLQEARLIRSAAAFKIYVLTKNMAPKIQAGSFRLKPSQNLPQITGALTKGSLDIWVTLLEGWRREEMAEKLSQELGVEFDADGFLTITKSQEGYLFPDTYLIPPTASASAVASLLTNTFDKKVGSVPIETVILASLIEREVRTDKDRPIIAGILLKRLKNGWPLQVDATVQYILGKPGNWWPQNLTRSDLDIKSAYNTYKNSGLPPAPIANPSLASIEAASNPQESDYWFYLSDLDGRIHYARSIEEHNSNIKKYLGK